MRTAPVILLVAALGWAGAVHAADDKPAAWPTFLGDGDRTPPKTGMELVDSLHKAPVLWELRRHMGVGKGLYPSSLRECKERNIEAFYAGASSPIVAEGLVFVSYYKPDGKVRAKPEGWRTVGEPTALLPDFFFSVTADDRLLAVDARTGEIRWEAIEQGKGANRLGHKRNHWCVSPAYADGRVFSLGTAGRLYAYSAAGGERLWEVLALPHLLEDRRKHAKAGALIWRSNLKNSLMVAGGNVIVPHGRLTAFDQKSGKKQWRTEERVISKHATPAPLTLHGKEYLLANDGAGSLHLIDAKSGKIAWTKTGLGNQIGTLTVTDGVAILNAGSENSDDKKNNGLFGAFRITPKGVEKLWTLPDEPKYRHSWTPDRGAERRAAIRDGNVYLVVGLKGLNRLVTADVKTGKIKAETKESFHAPFPMGDRLMGYDDRAHTDPITSTWWSLEDPDEPKLLHGDVGFGARSISGYEVPIGNPFVDGILYIRTLEGLTAYDLRQAPAGADNATLHATIPADVVGRRSDIHAVLVQRDGDLVHGSYLGAARQNAIDVTDTEWDGKTLTGSLGIDARGYLEFGEYQVDAVRQGDRLVGTIVSRLPAFENPRKIDGDIKAMKRQPAWMPKCDDVLWLEKAAFQKGGNAGRLLLFVSHAGGALKEVRGFADRTTKTPPVIQADGLKIENGRLKGAVHVRYRPDQWTTPLTEKGDSAAATYKIDAKLGQPDGRKVGEYSGTYGAEWTVKGKMK